MLKRTPVLGTLRRQSRRGTNRNAGPSSKLDFRECRLHVKRATCPKETMPRNSNENSRKRLGVERRMLSTHRPIAGRFIINGKRIHCRLVACAEQPHQLDDVTAAGLDLTGRFGRQWWRSRCLSAPAIEVRPRHAAPIEQFDLARVEPIGNHNRALWVSRSAYSSMLALIQPQRQLPVRPEYRSPPKHRAPPECRHKPGLACPALSVARPI